eukprot:2796796-Ditylum_brightwellii.AAC.3
MLQKMMRRAMKYCASTLKRRIKLVPKGVWDGRRGYLFFIEGYSDSKHAKDESCRSVNGWSVFLCEAPISYKSKIMPIVALSLTEAKLFAAVLCAQDMMMVLRIMNSMGLKVHLLMILYIDNKGSNDFVHNWSVGGRTRHIKVKQYFLCELHEAGIVECHWKRGSEMQSDIIALGCSLRSTPPNLLAFMSAWSMIMTLPKEQCWR